MLPDFGSLGIPALAGIFAAAAAVVWLAGARLSGYVEAISDRTGLGDAFLGALLLGGITSLPELATSVSASVAGDPRLAVNNLLGGVGMQVVILAAADLALGRAPLSSAATHPVILLQGVLLIGILALVIGAIVAGDPGAGPLGLWTIGILAATVLSFWIIRRNETRPTWRPVTEEGRKERDEAGAPRAEPERAPGADRPARSLSALLVRAALAGFAILAAGVTLTGAGEALATRTGLGSSFFGAVFLAISTSLPEVSTTVAAVRLGRYDMAFSNVLGANILDLGLIAVVDAVYRGPPVLDELGPFAILAAALAVLLTTVFLTGLLRRSARGFARMGVDSLAVLALYLGGVFLLFTMR